MRSVCKSFETATEMLKMENPNEAITSGSRRPFSSENGALGVVSSLIHTLCACECSPEDRSSRKTQYIERGGQGCDY
jgi:hypothetical protein